MVVPVQASIGLAAAAWQVGGGLLVAAPTELRDAGAGALKDWNDRLGAPGDVWLVYL
jgi:hypothetical protein